MLFTKQQLEEKVLFFARVRLFIYIINIAAVKYAFILLKTCLKRCKQYKRFTYFRQFQRVPGDSSEISTISKDFSDTDLGEGFF